MLSVDYIKTNKDTVVMAAKNKNRVIDIESILKLDENRRNLIVEIQKLREERNIAGKGKPTSEIIERGKVIKQELQKLELELSTIEEKLNTELLKVPNVPLPEVPIGKDESGNVETKKIGQIKKLDFEPKDHITLLKDLDMLELERGNKVSGFRGYFLKGKVVQLQFAVLFYAIQKLSNKGYTPFIAPSIAKGFNFFGNGQFPWGKEEVYNIGEDEYLAGTAEVPMMGLHSNETLKESELPKKYVAFSPCYRKEAGSYGKDTKGLYRVHEFYKIEQIILSDNNVDTARKLHEELQHNVEEILQELGLPFRVLLMCTGDMGEPQIKKYDTETWMPSRDGYGETMSNSIMGDFQCRRLNIKYKKMNGENEYCFSLNNTAVALPRLLIAILENHQEKDGSVSIPKVLQLYTGFDKLI